MAVGLAPGEAAKILNAVGNATNYTAPTAFWIQLHILEPGAAGTTSIAANATRKQVSFGAASGGTMTNDAAVTWTASESSTVETYGYWSGWTTSSGGTFLASGTVTAGAAGGSGLAFTLPAGAVVLLLSVAA